MRQFNISKEAIVLFLQRKQRCTTLLKDLPLTMRDAAWLMMVDISIFPMRKWSIVSLIYPYFEHVLWPIPRRDCLLQFDHSCNACQQLDYHHILPHVVTKIFRIPATKNLPCDLEGRTRRDNFHCWWWWLKASITRGISNCVLMVFLANWITSRTHDEQGCSGSSNIIANPN